ncbi:MAG TPA: hypothetical protein PKW32_17965 [Verrucomicrobiota bacterium]|nr:hypothetical protein [Verrucomicrobiota bacterium]
MAPCSAAVRQRNSSPVEFGRADQLSMMAIGGRIESGCAEANAGIAQPFAVPMAIAHRAKPNQEHSRARAINRFSKTIINASCPSSKAAEDCRAPNRKLTATNAASTEWPPYLFGLRLAR